jgi:hypothetical protein
MTTTVTLLWISFYLIFTKLPVTIVYGLQTTLQTGDHMSLTAMGDDPTWRLYLSYMTVRKIIEEIGISHHACNIFIYCLTSKQFRKHLWQLVKNGLTCRDSQYHNSQHRYAPAMQDPRVAAQIKLHKNGL